MLTKKELLEMAVQKLHMADIFLNQPSTEPTDEDLATVLVSVQRAEVALSLILTGEYKEAP